MKHAATEQDRSRPPPAAGNAELSFALSAGSQAAGGGLSNQRWSFHLSKNVAQTRHLRQMRSAPRSSNMNKIITICLILITATAYADSYDIPFTTVAEGWSIVRDKNDRTCSAVIYDEAGLKQFLDKYPIALDIKSSFFRTNLLIVGFSDTTCAVRCDGLKHKSNTNSAKLYLDLHDKGVMVKRAPTPEGKKYTAWCVVAAPNDLVISHVQIREGISGLCQQFGTRKLEP